MKGKTSERADIAERARELGLVILVENDGKKAYRLTEPFKRELLQVAEDIKPGGPLSKISTFEADEVDRAIILMATLRHCKTAIDPELCCVALFIETIVQATVNREEGPVDWRSLA
jgi:hypothetical protein